jgi:hypothetical protein
VRWLAPVRGALLAALVTLLTATGHVAGGGSFEQLSPLAVLVPMLVTVLVTLAERCRGILAVLTALGAGQAGLHHLLDLLGPHDHAGDSGAYPASMVAAHAVATVLVAPVVCAADAAVTGLVNALRRILPRRLRVPAVDVPLPARAVPGADVPLLAAVGLVVAHARRGPPVIA